MADPAVIGYWFSTPDDKLGHGDGRMAVLGQMLTVEPPIVPHQHGLHLAGMPFKALEYAPGPIAWLVQGSGTVVLDNGEYACSERTPLARHDVSGVLSDFARAEATLVLNYWDCPPEVTRWLLAGEDQDTAAAMMPRFMERSRDALGEAMKNAKLKGWPAVEEASERALAQAWCVVHAVEAAYYASLSETWHAAWWAAEAAALAQPVWAHAIQGAAGRFYESIRKVFNA